jgi:hypothetical protein
MLLGDPEKSGRRPYFGDSEWKFQAFGLGGILSLSRMQAACPQAAM